jgi:hypothetical protein
METKAPHIVASDRIQHGLVIYFDDGRRGFFSAALLYSFLDASAPIADAELDE